MKKGILIIGLAIFVVLMTSLQNTQKNYNNVIVLLDLSNRIAKPNQIEKDIAIIEGLLNTFGENQKKFGYITSKEEFKIIIANQKKGNPNSFALNRDLTIVMEQKVTFPIFEEKKKKLIAAVKQIYNEALSAAKKNETSGADIWGFFNTELNSLLKNEENFKNKLIILTDGYMDLDADIAKTRPKDTYMSYSQITPLRNKSNWETIYANNKYGLKPISVNLAPFEVLVMEVNPHEPSVYTNEFDIIKKYWIEWFSKMKINNNIIPTSDNSTVTRKQAADFINK